ncbi:MAG TPA: SRPBCC domain-containing protein [Roseiarcus sp.]|nr:SRPBCC domain-containing protein [Roseiarcus sp.]
MATLKVTASAPPDQPTITMEREFAAPPEAVFRAFSDAEALRLWYGPDGFSITVIAMDFRVGGLFRFTMHAPDGTDFPNRIRYREIAPFERLSYRHGVDSDDDPNAFEVVNVFTRISDKRTLLVRTATFPSIDARNAVMKFGAVELGMQTIEKLAAYLEALGA